MGYSMTAIAGLVMECLMERVGDKTSSNMYSNGQYFWERGREHDDGRMTGSVYKNLPDNMARKVGSYHITSTGIVYRFPGIPRKHFRPAENQAKVRYRVKFGAHWYE